MLFNKKFDLVISLGEDCAVAGHLNALGLRNFSSPFDWVNGSTIEKRVDIICNNFKDRFNKDYIIKLVGDDENDIEKQLKLSENLNKVHESFINTKTGIKFHHDFVYNRPFLENIKLNKEKYERRIKNLQDKIEMANKILFVYLARGKDDFETLQKCIQKLNNYKNNKFYLLYIEDNKQFEDTEYSIRKHNNLYYVQINNISTDHTSDYDKLMGNIDIIRDIILQCLYEIKYSPIEKKTCLIRKILNSIFSIHNEYPNNIKYKVIKFLGIKFKIKTHV